MEVTSVWLMVMAVAVYLVMEAIKYFNLVDSAAESNRIQNIVAFVLSLVATGIVAWQTDPVVLEDGLFQNIDILVTWVGSIWGASTLLHHRVKDALGKLLSGEE
jgi:hypothetical protein